MTARTFVSNAVRLAFLDEGEGEPILLLHGFASNARVNWVDTGWVETLTKAGLRVLAPDQRGHGLSEKLYRPEDYGSRTMAADALHLLDYCGIERAHVMGYSMGARVAAFLALDHPERVRRLTFGGLGINMVRPVAGTGPIAHALEAPSLDAVKNPTARTFRDFAERTRSDLKALAACIRGAREPITAGDVAKFACPVLVVAGADDVIGGSAKALARLIPNAEAVEIAGRDHMKTVGDRAYKEAVLQFLERA